MGVQWMIGYQSICSDIRASNYRSIQLSIQPSKHLSIRPSIHFRFAPRSGLGVSKVPRCRRRTRPSCRSRTMGLLNATLRMRPFAPSAMYRATHLRCSWLRSWLYRAAPRLLRMRSWCRARWPTTSSPR